MAGARPGRTPEADSPLDVARIIGALEAHRVEYLLVGGIAAGLYGARRVTRDLDLLARTERENLDRLAAALRDLGAYLRVGGLDEDEARALPVVIDGASLAAMQVSTWRTDAGDVDILTAIPDESGVRRGFDDLAARASETTVDGLAVRVAALRDIVESKRFADRDKDREAIPELEQLLRDLG